MNGCANAGPTLLAAELIARVIAQLPLDPRGLHGLGHWALVLDNGLRLARITGADTRVVELFALFHDSRRLNENADPEHGPRGALLAEQLRGSDFSLADPPFALLLAACQLHTVAPTFDNVTVQTCFDADRLDLARTGRIVDPHRLCTEAAKDSRMIEWATRQSLEGIVPDNPLGQALRALPICGESR